MATETYLPITDLPPASEIDDNSLLAVAKNGASYKMAGSVLRGYTEGVATKVVEEALDGKQDTLTFDNAPTQGSVNPVTSGGVYSAIATEADERLRADRAQQALITREISDRQSADAETRTYLTNEVRDREDADDLLRDAIADIEDDLEDYAKTDGSYDAMTVGAAEQLLSNNYIENTTPYIFRKTADGASVGNQAHIDELVGGTIVWNQLVQNGNFASTSNWTAENGRFSVSDNVASFYVDPVEEGQPPNAGSLTQNIQLEKGRKYMMVADLRASVPKHIFINFGNVTDRTDLDINWKTICIPHAPADAETGLVFRDEDDPDGRRVDLRNIMVIDLTLMFGSQIADYIYSLGNTAALAWFRELFPNNYYAYDAGSLKSYSPTIIYQAYKTTGLNQWDEKWELGSLNSNGEKTASTTAIRSKNLIPIIPGGSYYFHNGTPGIGMNLCFYDENNVFLSRINNAGAIGAFTVPNRAAYCLFNFNDAYGTTYKRDVCLNLSSDRNGEYEPYQEFSYYFPAATLRGVPKLDANNRLYYDGDTYSQSGTITSRFEQARLSARNWTMVSAGIFQAWISGRAFAAGKFNLRCNKYATQEASNSTSSNIQSLFNTYGNGLYVNGGSNIIYICDASCSTLSEFQSAIAGGVLIYEKATATTTSEAAFPSTIVVDRYGTERFVDSRAVPVPVGHVTRYTQDLAGKLEAQPDVAPDDGDYIIRQTSGKMSLSPLYGAFSSPVMHRILYRGKNLGSEFTSAQKAAIAAGTFDDIWLGDYWTIDGVTYVVADFDYWYNCGSTLFTRHHIVVIPANSMYDAKMNATNTTTGGYANSGMRGAEVEGTFTPYAEGCGLYDALAAFRSAFGDALLTHKEFLCNTVSNGVETRGSWLDSTVDLPSEAMIYGQNILARSSQIGTVSKSQLALMATSPLAINIAQSYWLRDASTTTGFARADKYGNATVYNGSVANGVRPVAAIG